jgi:hypothetical protein
MQLIDDDDYYHIPAGGLFNFLLPGGFGQPSAFCAKPHRHLKRFGVEWNGATNLYWVVGLKLSAAIHPLRICDGARRADDDYSDIGGNWARMRQRDTLLTELKKETIVSLEQPKTVFTGQTPKCSALRIYSVTSIPVKFTLAAGGAEYTGETSDKTPGEYGWPAFDSRFAIPNSIHDWQLTAELIDEHPVSAYVKVECLEHYDEIQTVSPSSGSGVFASFVVIIAALLVTLL